MKLGLDERPKIKAAPQTRLPVNFIELLSIKI